MIMYQNQSKQVTTDIIIHDDKQGMCMLIEVAIPGDRNVIMTEADILK
jgi:hypothetical protein